MIIDCGKCTVRGAACANCAVTFIADAVTFVTGATPARQPHPAVPSHSARQACPDVRPHPELDAAEMRALAVLANAGLIPPLQYAPPMAKAS